MNKKPVDADKPFLRQFFLGKRNILLKNNETKRAADLEIQSRLILSEEYRKAEVVLIYMAKEDEIATAAILCAALMNRKTVAAPRCTGKGEMHFFRVRSLSDFVVGRYGILEPTGDEEVIPDERALCVCPALCCDMRGNRLGWGGGYYDRYLSAHPCVKASLCYSDSLIPQIEAFPYDVPMDVIFTENYTRHIIHGESAV